MKFAIHNINPFKINSEDKDSISEVIIPYYNQINALQEVLAINENGYNTILDIPIAAFDRTLEV
jgi:hypothetical protein